MGLARALKDGYNRNAGEPGFGARTRRTGRIRVIKRVTTRSRTRRISIIRNNLARALARAKRLSIRITRATTYGSFIKLMAARVNARAQCRALRLRLRGLGAKYRQRLAALRALKYRQRLGALRALKYRQRVRGLRALKYRQRLRALKYRQRQRALRALRYRRGYKYRRGYRRGYKFY